MTTIPRRKKPKPYLDTNVILDYIRKRNTDSEVLLDTIRKRKIKCWTSYYTVLELIDKGQESKWVAKRLNEYHETFDDILRKRYPRQLTINELQEVFIFLKNKFFTPFVDAGIVNMVDPPSNDWNNIISLLARGNYTTVDAIHVDSALGASCNIFITNDTDLIKLLKDDKLIPVSTTMNLDKVLAENGIRSIVPFQK